MLGHDVTVHPRFLIDAETLAVLRLWRRCRGAGMSAGPLPFSGGAAEQPACLLAAFDICEAALADLDGQG